MMNKEDLNYEFDTLEFTNDCFNNLCIACKAIDEIWSFNNGALSDNMDFQDRIKAVRKEIDALSHIALEAYLDLRRKIIKEATE